MLFHPGSTNGLEAGMRGSHKLVAGADGAGREAGLPTGWRSAVEEAAAGIGAGGERRRSADCGAGQVTDLQISFR